MINEELVENLLNITNCCKFKGDCMGCTSCSSINTVQDIIIENDKLKIDNEFISYSLRINKKLVEDQLKVLLEYKNEIKKLKIERDSVVSLHKDCSSELNMRMKEIEQLKAELEQLVKENEKLLNMIY